MGEGVETVRCVGCDLDVPASAEFILEGYVEPGETRPEGPFGNHTGFYAPPTPASVFHLERITRRSYPIFPCTVVGPPPTENLWLARATERIFLPILQGDCPEVADLRFLAEGAFHGCALVAVAPHAAGRGLDLIRSLWKKGLLSGSRLLVAVDADADLDDGSRILWRLINQVDPERDVIVENGRLGIDGTEEGNRSRVTQDAQVLQRVRDRWKEFGID
jgi:4-hydroxy-3-polyprenylbenzoate decarboxylase